MENLDRRMLLAGLGLVGAAAAASAGAGTLNPPAGPVAPTGKTTDEIEPRVAVQNLAGDVASVHRITQPGSYYLLDNINSVAGKAAIAIEASNVTLDLGGFALIGVAGATNGVEIRGGRNQIVVCNGSIRTFDDGGIVNLTSLATNVRVERISVRGIVSGSGIRAPGAGSHVVDCELTSIGGDGIFVSVTSGLVERCVVSGCSGSSVDGIDARTVSSCMVESIVSTNDSIGIRASTVSDCTVQTVSGATFSGGINAFSVTGCSVHNVGLTTSAGGAIGIIADSACGVSVNQVQGGSTGTVTGISANVVSNSNVEGLSQGTSNGDMAGIVANVVVACLVSGISGASSAAVCGILDASVVRDCEITAVSNSGAGSAVGLRKTSNNAGSIENCVFRSCGDAAVSVRARQRIVGCTIQTATAGILAADVRNVIDGNTIDSCTTGISVTSGTNTAQALVVHNQIRNCTTNILADSPCQVGPVITATGTITSTSPWANFTD
jgi:hypothetical protein